MSSTQQASKQLKLEQHQIEAFYTDGFAKDQVTHFKNLIDANVLTDTKVVVDVGGGCGYFAKELQEKTGLKVRVIDSDKKSIEICRSHNIYGIEAYIDDATHPAINGDEDIICFNLILHHLIGKNEAETTQLQQHALEVWKNQTKLIFVNEYIYDSYIKNVTGRIIFEITKNKFLSYLCSLVSKLAPSLKANTFGVGVRFRAHNEWVRLFEECGFEVIAKAYGESEYISLPRRLLLIDETRRDSFILKAKSESTRAY